MRTKALLCLAVVTAGFTCATQAQVYSANVVGYINVPIPAAQYVMIANQLDATNNNIATVLANAPAGAIFQKYTGTGYSAYSFDDVDGWLPDGNATLNPGEGGFFRSPTATTLTFVGEVREGSLTNSMPIGSYAIRSSIVPQAGGLGSVLGFPGEDGDIVQTFNGSNYSAANFDLVDGWLPAEPNIKLGESFFVKKASTSTQSNWVRNFDVQ